MTTPSGTTPSRTNRHSAISSLRAKATIMVLRCFRGVPGPLAIPLRQRSYSSRTAEEPPRQLDHGAPDTGIAGAGEAFLTAHGPPRSGEPVSPP